MKQSLSVNVNEEIGETKSVTLHGKTKEGFLVKISRDPQWIDS